jgi:hypothetical protein
MKKIKSVKLRKKRRYYKKSIYRDSYLFVHSKEMKSERRTRAFIIWARKTIKRLYGDLDTPFVSKFFITELKAKRRDYEGVFLDFSDEPTPATTSPNSPLKE